MIRLKIDTTDIKVPGEISVLAAARMHGMDIPSVCYREGKPHFTSCMICMVKDGRTGKLFPSCSVNVSENMEVITIDDEIRESRRTALELLLSEHTGDCEAPCQVTCPAHMDIPLMNRLLAAGKIDEAVRVVKRDIALPSVFGRVCPAPCEGACRRKSVDTPVSICLLKRYAGDEGTEPVTSPARSSGKKVAVIGAGPAGLASAYYLQLKGHACTLIDRREKPGGSLWTEVENGTLPEEVLAREVEVLRLLGCTFRQHEEIDAKGYRMLKEEFDALLIATGSGESGAGAFGPEMSGKGVRTEDRIYVTSEEGVFAAGSAVKPNKLAIRALGQGKEAAFSIDQFLAGKKVTGEPSMFNSRFGKLQEVEIAEYLKEAHGGSRIEPADLAGGFTIEQVREEAARCLHCDCRDKIECRLRLLSDEYRASQKRFWSEDRTIVQKQIQHDVIIYEPNKCIKCGKCVHITAEHKEKYGMSFIGRGFDVVIGVPFQEALDKGLTIVAEQVVQECPTGALSMKDQDDQKR